VTCCLVLITSSLLHQVLVLQQVCSWLFCTRLFSRYNSCGQSKRQPFRILPQDVGKICVLTPTDVEDWRTASTFGLVQDTVGKLGTRIGLRHCPTSRKAAGSIPDGFIGIFHWHNSFLPHYDPGVDSASYRNEYQEYFLGDKGGRCLGLTTLPPS
jgi:hypothetical protein